MWALGTRLEGVQVSGFLEELRGPPAIPAWYDLSLAPGYGAMSFSQLKHGCNWGPDSRPQAALGSLQPEAHRHLQGQLPLSAPSSPIAGTPFAATYGVRVTRGEAVLASVLGALAKASPELHMHFLSPAPPAPSHSLSELDPCLLQPFPSPL